MQEDQILINQYAQDLVNEAEMQQWFSFLSLPRKREILQNLFFMIGQAHPSYKDLETAIDAAPVRKRCTPAVMLQNKQKPFLTFHHEIIALPGPELMNSFLILIHLFYIADHNRRQACGTSCNHWWHKDLSSYHILEKHKESHC